MPSRIINEFKKIILSGILPIFILGSIIHFGYDWCSITPIGLIAPINSSIWEHMKMAVLPTIIWWGLTYLLFHFINNLNSSY